MKKEISLKFSAISFFMTCAIVLYHFKVEPALYLGNIDEKIYLFVSNVIDNFANIAMGYFFATTGFFLYRNLDASNVKAKIKKRCFSLLIPYVLWNIIYFIDRIIQGDKFIFDEIVFKLIFKPFDGPLWYMLAIFALALLAPLFIRIFKNHRKWIIFLIAIYVASYYMTSVKCAELINFTDFGWYIERLIRYIPNYFTGAIVAMHFENIIENYSKKTNILAIIIFLISIILIGQNILNSNLIWIVNRIQPFLIWYIILPHKKEIPNKLKLLYSSSFIIYAMHIFIINKYDELSKIITIKPSDLCGIETIIFRLFMALVVILLCVILWYVLKKITPKTLNVLTGGRLK